ncbi:MAG: hypothetical protein ACFFBP_15955 [Promethearchaeota archaeon]
MKKIQVRCPKCLEMGYIQINDNDVQTNIRGVTGINIMESVICKHAFVVYIDNNYELRDCFSTDFTIKLPELKLSEEIAQDDLIDIDNINLNLITTNIFALTLAYILRAGFYKRRILFLNDNEELNHNFSNFINYCFLDSFDIFIEVKERWEYNREKKKYKHYIIIENERVIKDKEKIMNPKMMKIESIIVQTFLAESDPKTSIIMLKNEIKKAYHLTKDVSKYIKAAENIEDLKPKNLMKYLDMKYTQDVNKYYLKFLIQILINYFNFNLKEKFDFFNLFHWSWYLK